MQLDEQRRPARCRGLHRPKADLHPSPALPEQRFVAAPRLHAGAERLDHRQPEPGCEPRHVVQRPHDVRHARGPVGRRIVDLNPVEIGEVRQQRRPIERRRDGLSPAGLAQEREVGDLDTGTAPGAPPCCQADRARRRTTPSRRPGPDPPSSAAHPTTAIREMRFAGPPDRHRQVVDEQRRDTPARCWPPRRRRSGNRTARSRFRGR